MASITAQYGGASAALRATPLRKWFVTNARAQHVPLDEVVTRFASSCAGYSVATHVLGVADRHNDNVMVRPSGHVFHIDFGHILGNFKTKFGFKRETAPFVLTKDFVNVIGEGEPFERFVELGAAAFAVARATAPLLFDLLRLMVPAQLPELRSVDAIQHMVQALRLDLAPLDAIDHWRALTLERAVDAPHGAQQPAAHRARRRPQRASTTSARRARRSRRSTTRTTARRRRSSCAAPKRSARRSSCC
jgi:phosphatidylinositol-4,5-bisphosphate 3-kinase